MTADTAKEGELLVSLGVLDAAKLEVARARQNKLAGEGKTVALADIAVQLGFATPDQAGRALAHEKLAHLRCPKCRKKFTVPDFKANRRYKCAPDQAYLEFRADDNPRVPEGGGEPEEIVPSNDRFAGKTFGKYKILRRIAKGGMGLVYLGQHADLPKKVAVKILSEEFARMPGIRARYKREGVAGGRLEHPNIVQILDMDEQDGQAYIVSEFIDGPALVDVINKEKKLPPDRAVAIACDILAALQHAHEHGVVHRDIKPQNILMTTQGRAKVIDFGLAMDAEAQTILTMAGNIMGSPSYMSPEQAKGERGGPLSDQYSCGVLLYLMLTGRKPFEGRSLLETLDLQVNKPLPPIRAAHPAVSELLENVIRKMTAKAPEERYPACREAIDGLQRAMKGEAEPTKPVAKKKPKAPSGTMAAPKRGVPAWVWPVAGVVLLVVAAVLWWYFHR